MTKEQSHATLELYNVRIEPLNVIKQIREPPNVTKELSHVMFGTAQCKDETVKCDVLVTWYSRLLFRNIYIYI